MISRIGLEKHGLSGVGRANWNWPAAVLVQAAIARGEGHIVEEGAFAAETGAFTGRSPNDKYIVDHPSIHDTIDWGKVNRPISREHAAGLRRKITEYMTGREVFVQDLHAGADPEYRLNVRVVTCTAWHNLFARNMFIGPERDQLSDFDPDFTVIQAPEVKADPKADGTASETFIVVDFVEKVILIGGTLYAGEIKKSIFGVLNYILPDRGVMPMHCSANIGPDGDVAVFFGLSGTGKTTLSADASRTLIGDDEHGWSPRGVFNFEGGCYAKVIDLSPKAEPEIYAASRRFGTILENTVFDPQTGIVDFADGSRTQNTRSSYPLSFIPNASATGLASHPKNIVMLTADAFGVLPPLSQLSPEQAMYHFLSGYTARVAGTERGVTEPQATFSTCFGAPFMPRHPSVYAGMLGDLMRTHGTKCWLVNTGWSGGGYGEGSRIRLAYTRAMVRAALAGKLADTEMAVDPHFGLRIPQICPDVPSDILAPRQTWNDPNAYDGKARELAKRFEANFRQFEGYVSNDVRSAAVTAAA
ncbi:phosphoenolpyruvate carboxykinase [Marinivivus vitaminiproducens]|uniref:phosphoenolpyruvate carboxykinase n=1 Tax=Marinivivus vitaminiproducens TaxID=3035935 RepID=UPI0027A3AADA|nr:phosphoenolpyruvate carboxykinase [Geminicoccaceae bacterium SCSIO 64248]